MFNSIKTPKIKDLSLQNEYYSQINAKHENNEILEIIDTLDLTIKHFTLGEKRLFPNAIFGCDSRWNGFHVNIRLKFKIGVEATSEYHTQCEFHKYGGIMRLGWIFNAKDKKIIDDNIYSIRGNYPCNELQHIEEIEFIFLGRGKHKLAAPKSIIISNPSLERKF